MQPDTLPPHKNRILVVDADTMTCELLQFRLESSGFYCEIVNNGSKALEHDISSYNLVLVDLMDKEFNGVMLTQTIKRNPSTFSVPIIIISKKASEDDIVSGLDAGADDYITKPFSSRILIARIRSVLRRKRMMNSRRSTNILQFRNLVLDLGAGTASINGQMLALTRTEYLILALFLRNLNNFFERVEIRNEAWEDEKSVSDRAVDTNISRLRKKLGEYGHHIVNRQGFGYGFVE